MLPKALPRPGDVVAGKYELVRVLGEGGMGVVFEANHVRLRQRVAVKMLLPHMVSEAVIVTRFEREARAAAQLRSRHVARVMDVDVTDAGLPYMVMELLQGHDLDAELVRRGKIPSEEAVDYVLQACAAMNEAHQLGIVHRDLKPSNLFLEREGAAVVVKVLDFGISKVQGDADKLTAADAIMGTAHYMSPEQVRSAQQVDARSDIWALGVILYELLCGEPPFTGTTTQVAAAIVTEDAPDLRARCVVPTGLVDAIRTAMKRDPAERHADVRALAAALLPYAAAGGAGRSIVETFERPSVPGPGRARSISSAPPSARVAAAAPTEVDSSTAPGWTQRGAETNGGRRSRRVLFGGAAVVALAVGIAAGVRTRGGPVAADAHEPSPTHSDVVPSSAPPPRAAPSPEPVVTLAAVPDAAAPPAPRASSHVAKPTAAPSSPKPATDAPPQLPPPPIPRIAPSTKPRENPLTL